MKKILRHWKVIIGLLLSALFMFLAFRRVDFKQMGYSFAEANYWFLFPALLVIFLSHWLRALRWRYLLEPIQRIENGVLFSSLLIGYMANTFLPAHLGEFLRAFMVAKKRALSGSAVFATIVIERIIDVITLLFLMVLAIFIFSFPLWVKKSGLIMFVLIMLLLALLVVMKIFRKQTVRVVEQLTRPLSEKSRLRINHLLHAFLEGITPLGRPGHYVVVAALSILIWMGYACAFQFGFYAFDFVSTYHLPWSAALVTLIITTISVVVPSSPGYVGTYHYLCQLSLSLFAIPRGTALTFAVVMHGINFLPVLVVGLILLWREGMSLKSIQKKDM